MHSGSNMQVAICPISFREYGSYCTDIMPKGGRICVVSLSTKKTILRDYSALLGLTPDAIFGWDLPEEQRKPNAYPLLQIMERFSLAPDQLLVVDDMKPAWEMACSVGAPIAFAGWGKKNCPQILSEMTALCDYAFTEISDFADFLFSK